MAESSIIKEFLVKLGYKTDTQAIDKFKHEIANATKVVVGFALAVEATAVAVSVGVGKFASNLEALYFASIRTGTAAGSLKAFDRAAQSFGASAGAALSSAESLARFFRQNPAGGDYLNALLGQIGESAYNKAGKLKEMPELLTTVGKLFASNQRQGQGFMNYQISDLLGIDEKTMLAIQDGSFARKYAELNKQINTPAFKHAADGAHHFMESLRGLENQLYIVGIQIVDTLQKKLGVSLDSISQWLAGGGGQFIADKVTEIVGGMIDDFNQLLHWGQQNWPIIRAQIIETFFNINWYWQMYVKPAFVWIYKKLTELDTATDGWSTKLIVLTALLNALGLTSLVGGILSLSAAVLQLGASMLTLGSSTAGVVAARGALGAFAVGAGQLTGAVGAGVGLGYLVNKYFPDNWIAEAVNWVTKKLPGKTSLQSKLDSYGLRASEKAGIMSNIFAESGGDSSAFNRDKFGNTHMGLFQFGPQWQARYSAWADAKNAKGGSYSRLLNYSHGEEGSKEQIEFFLDMLQNSKDPGMRRLRAVMQANRANGALGANEIAQSMVMDVEKPYNHGQGLEEEADKRGAGAVAIYNTWNINEATDAHKVAEIVTEHQKKQWAGIAREHAAVGIQ